MKNWLASWWNWAIVVVGKRCEETTLKRERELRESVMHKRPVHLNHWRVLAKICRSFLFLQHWQVEKI
ncbi:hypothetical protein BBJ29_000875 [Phytophthora kernoviae]|uniref:Uncharacterized protein n=1 Tax=Phytophthora kernoviae TaxID=325452 RepID=A0A3F2S3P5_9STRA|nr:hypothetical protein BBJ29_000875 [Phytophthora kernoviae]RLN68889.1 hypothetical protein BBP00_00000756 [Phytophthora kernoviae]